MLPFFDEDHLALRGRVRTWAEKNLTSLSAEPNDVEEMGRRLVRQIGREGFLTYTVPKDYAGMRRTVQARDLCVIREELARASALADTMFAIQALGSHPITMNGTEEQKLRYLPPIAKGEAIAAFALTEPDSGSDASSLQTHAVRRGKEYVLTGTKRFISNAGIADTYVVFASTDPEKRSKGISAFIVEADVPGLIVKEKTSLVSRHPIGVIAFEDCMIRESSRLGREGEGLKIALRTLDTLRCTVAASSVGLAQRALEEAIQYSQNRQQFGQAIADFQATQFKLAEMATKLEAARLLVYQAAWANDTDSVDLKQKASMAKLFATEAAQKIIDEALQIHGAVGLIAGTVMERLYRDVRALRIYEGTSEIQKLIIARSLLEKPRVEN